MSPGSPGPPPTSATPGGRFLWCRAAIVPAAIPVVIASRIAALRLGSPLSTPTLTSVAVPEAGVQAVDLPASSARTHHILRVSASSATFALTSAGPAQAQTSHAPSQSPFSYGRRRQLIRPAAASSSTAGVAAGETSSTSAPAASSRGTRRAATAPPPTTTTRLPRSRRPSRYASSCRPVTDVPPLAAVPDERTRRAGRRRAMTPPGRLRLSLVTVSPAGLRLPAAGGAQQGVEGGGRHHRAALLRDVAQRGDAAGPQRLLGLRRPGQAGRDADHQRGPGDPAQDLLERVRRAAGHPDRSRAGLTEPEPDPGRGHRDARGPGEPHRERPGGLADHRAASDPGRDRRGVGHHRRASRDGADTSGQDRLVAHQVRDIAEVGGGADHRLGDRAGQGRQPAQVGPGPQDAVAFRPRRITGDGTRVGHARRSAGYVRWSWPAHVCETTTAGPPRQQPRPPACP